MAARIIEGTNDLETLLGQEAGVSEWLAVTQEMVDRFAELTGDRQWIHIDRERARRESPFGTTVAHGFLTVALLSKMVKQAVEVRGDFRLGVNYGFNRLRFPAPVKTESRIRAHVTPHSVKQVDGGIEIAWGVTVEIDGEAKPALAAEWIVRMYH
jgi:acyl dehydratase